MAAEVASVQTLLAQAALDAQLADQFLAGSQATADRAQSSVDALTGARRAGAERLADARDRLREVAATAYVSGEAEPLAAVLSSSNPTELVRRRTLVEAVGVRSEEAVSDYELAAASVSGEVRQVVERRRMALHALRAAKTDARVAAAHVAELQAELAALLAELGDVGSVLLSGRGGSVVGVVLPDSDLPLVALDAYRRAASYANSVFGDCSIGWWAIAGIGKVESNHGRYGGAHLAVDGDVVPHIRGIALDGTRGTRAIRDTDGGAVDGDVVWDRAVGPMQFLPSTWAGYDRLFDLDARGTGRHSPDNIYDAARATGLYLCRSGGDMSSTEGMRRAFFAYNHSSEYVDNVLDHAVAYAGLSAPVLADPVVIAPVVAPATTTPAEVSATSTTTAPPGAGTPDSGAAVTATTAPSVPAPPAASG